MCSRMSVLTSFCHDMLGLYCMHDMLTNNFMIGLCSGSCLPRLSSSIEASLFWFIWTSLKALYMILSLSGLKPILIRKPFENTILHRQWILFAVPFTFRHKGNTPLFKGSLYHIMPLRNPILSPKQRADIMSFLLWKELRTFLCKVIIWPLKTQYLHVSPSFLIDVLLQSCFSFIFLVPMIWCYNSTLPIVHLYFATVMVQKVDLDWLADLIHQTHICRTCAEFLTDGRISLYASLFHKKVEGFVHKLL